MRQSKETECSPVWCQYIFHLLTVSPDVNMLLVTPATDFENTIKIQSKVKFTLQQVTKAHKGNRGIAILFL
jgi:hypothetical protein